MIRKFMPGVVGFGFAAALCAQEATQKYDWRPVNGVQDVHVEVNRVVLSQLDFDLGQKMAPLRSSTARAVARVDNNGFIPQEIGVAIAIFDTDGNLVAAGSGGVKVGYLSKGERDTFTIRFPFVYRNMDKAASFIVSIETREKPPKPPKTPKPAAVGPTPAPK
jgi:hypothetical protein